MTLDCIIVALVIVSLSHIYNMIHCINIYCVIFTRVMLQFQSLAYVLSKIGTKLASSTSLTNKFYPINACMSNLPTNPIMSFSGVLPQFRGNTNNAQGGIQTHNLLAITVSSYHWAKCDFTLSLWYGQLWWLSDHVCVFIDICNCQLPLTSSTVDVLCANPVV